VGERAFRRGLPRVALGSVAAVALFRDARTRELFGTAAFYATLARGIAGAGGGSRSRRRATRTSSSPLSCSGSRRRRWSGRGARWRSALGTHGVDLLGRLLPFTRFVVWGVLRAAVAARHGPDDRHRAILRLLFAWLVAVLVDLAARETHRERYLVLPPLALLGGREVARFARAAIPAGSRSG